MLRLLNEVRNAAGVPLLEMGDNIALQLHAEAQLRTCDTSYWSEDGLKDYMGYTLAGGYQFIQSISLYVGSENHCLDEFDGYALLPNPPTLRPSRSWWSNGRFSNRMTPRSSIPSTADLMSD